MNPDLNQLRRDLGLPAPNQGGNTGWTPNPGVEPIQDPPPRGFTLSSFGGWLLTLLGIALAVWLLADPICMLALLVWEVICAVAIFIFNLFVWLIVLIVVLSIICHALS